MFVGEVVFVGLEVIFRGWFSFGCVLVWLGLLEVCSCGFSLKIRVS